MVLFRTELVIIILIAISVHLFPAAQSPNEEIEPVINNLKNKKRPRIEHLKDKKTKTLALEYSGSSNILFGTNWRFELEKIKKNKFDGEKIILTGGHREKEKLTLTEAQYLGKLNIWGKTESEEKPKKTREFKQIENKMDGLKQNISPYTLQGIFTGDFK